MQNEIRGVIMKLSQNEKIIQYIEENGSISPLEALREFGCMRLASRISDLRKAGFPITSEMETTKNKKGETIRFARYRLLLKG